MNLAIPRDGRITGKRERIIATVKGAPVKLLRYVLLVLGRLISRILLRITIEGREHLPQKMPLIVISNHFSWFDAPLLTSLLPFQPAFLVATESQNRWFVRLFIQLYNGIPIWRGQVDRRALQKALMVLEKGEVLGIFPEGGIDPKVAGLVARGERINAIRGHASRQNAELVQPKPGVALLAVESQAQLLPVGLIGTEKILENLSHWRRTEVTLRIGPIFGPFTLDPSLQGRARRQRLDALADLMMQRIAALFPPEKRGPYRHMELESNRVS